MPASQPTILATSIGFQSDGPDRWNFRPGPAYNLAARLAGAGTSGVHGDPSSSTS